MRNIVVKKLDGWMPYNKCMKTHVEAFFSGTFDDKGDCEKFIQKNHPHAIIIPVRATLYYEIPETETFCNKSKKCRENICFCNDLIDKGLKS